MKGLDVLAKLSGIPENEVSVIYKNVMDNQKKLESCKRHDFSIDTVPHTTINKTLKCTQCEGNVNSSAKMWYELGFLHGEEST
jgi:hypothetical protein